MENFTGAIEIATVPGIAAIVYGLIELYGRALTKAQKPPVAGTLAIAWALAAWLLLGVFPDPLTAIASGIFSPFDSTANRRSCSGICSASSWLVAIR